MCTNIDVTLPRVVTFLLLYSLRAGSLVILIWTVVRSFFYLCFFMFTIIETFLPKNPPLRMFEHKPEMPKHYDDYYLAFMGLIVMIATESILFLYSVVFFGMGMYFDSPPRIEQYLVCRFCTWLVEVTFLVDLCLSHLGLIGWYLVFLMFVILEFYGFIVVYSYYRDMLECAEERGTEEKEPSYQKTKKAPSDLVECDC